MIGFTISTEVCKFGLNGLLPEYIQKEIDQAISFIEEKSGKKLGDPSKPLLLSVRSGAAVSMPGMMDTVLDLGMNDVVAEGLIAITSRPTFVMDCYRRFVDIFSRLEIFDLLMRKNFLTSFILFTQCSIEYPSRSIREALARHEKKSRGKNRPRAVCSRPKGTCQTIQRQCAKIYWTSFS